MSAYRTKADVYNDIDILRDYYKIPQQPLSAFQIVRSICKKPDIVTIGFEESSICGILYKGTYITKICLNSNHSKTQQNYYCGHEFIHYCWHNSEDQTHVCHDIANRMNDFTEWQANEGSAELLMAYRIFIPDFVDRLKKHDLCPTVCELSRMYDELGYKYHVTPTVIKYRVNGLLYEIMQYISGTSLNSIQFVARHRQEEMGFQISIRDLFYAAKPRPKMEWYSASLGKTYYFEYAQH